MVELGRKQSFSLDICDGNLTLTLALVWQLMRSYTLNMLSNLPQLNKNGKVVESEIIRWANSKLREAGKESQIGEFQDQAISTKT